jgi:hypothetical protein
MLISPFQGFYVIHAAHLTGRCPVLVMLPFQGIHNRDSAPWLRL